MEEVLRRGLSLRGRERTADGQAETRRGCHADAEGLLRYDQGGDPVSRILGDTAILSYDTDETEIVFGQHLTARYHGTDTWLRRDGVWQIVATQTMRYYEDPAIGRADPAKFPEFSGTYELAEGQTRKVTAEGESLFVERNGKREQLFPESAEIFFRKNVEGRILFRSGPDGKVDALIDRRNNEDIVWQKKVSD